MTKHLHLKKVLAAVLTIAALATGQTAWAWDGSGTSDSPWLIKTTDDLVALANNSASNTYYGKFFRLENDLDMNGVAIGTIGGNIKRFKGTFDGNGHAIRNLTINKPDDNYVALFGIINANSTIRNLIIDGANITGNNYVGVIFGCTFDGGTIENCLVVNSSVTVTSSTGTYGGIISGCYLDNLTFSGNYYYNCSVTMGSNAPVTTNIATTGGDIDGAAIADATATVSLPDAWVTFGANQFVVGGYYYNGTIYYDSSIGYTVGPATWAALQTAFNNASTDADNPTELTLAADITASASDSYLNLTGGRKVILDLNGHTLSRGLTAATTDGYVIRVIGTNTSLTIRDGATGGTITGGWSNSGPGCISVTSNATLRLESGTISGNRVNRSGGTISITGGTVYITGGTITGNWANIETWNNNSFASCGAIYFNEGGTLYMSGGAITGNRCRTTTLGAAGIGASLMLSHRVHLSGSYNISGNEQGDYDEATGEWSNLTPSDILNNNRTLYILDGPINPVAPAHMILDHDGSSATFTSGWATHMGSTDPEQCFTLDPATGKGLGIVDGEVHIGTLHTLTLADGLTASVAQAAQGKSVTLSGASVGTTGGITYTTDYIVSYNDGTNDHVDHYTADDQGNATFVMPDANVTVSTETVASVTYIDADGNEQTITDFTIVSSSYEFGDDFSTGTALLGVDDYTERWYAVVGTVSLDKRLSVEGNARLILCDAAALIVNADYDCGTAFDVSYNGLTIYGQAQGTGTLSVTNTGGAIHVSNNITVNGGTVIATSTDIFDGIHIFNGRTLTINRGTLTASGGNGIHINGTLTQNGGTLSATGAYGISIDEGTLTLNGGTLNATGSGTNYAGIYATYDATVNILGGILNATGTADAYGIYATGDGTTVTLGWTTPDDRITASSYSADNSTIKVKDGQILTDNTYYYSGTLTNEQLTAMAGQTLEPAFTFSITLPNFVTASGSGVTVINGVGYAVVGTTVTLAPEANFITLSDVSVTGTTATNNNDGTWSFTMPAADATVTATVTLGSVPYIDANGNEQTITDFTIVSSSYEFETDGSGNALLGVNDATDRWYAVVDTVNLDKPLLVQGAAHLILCDGAALNVNADYDSGHAFDVSYYGLTIYGQAQSTGTLRVTNTGTAICINLLTTVNGGTVIATSTSSWDGICIRSNATLTINRGTVTATGGGDGIYILNNSTLSQNGGTLNATGSRGIYITQGTLTQNGGILNATGIYAYYAPGIYANCATVNILGGSFNATGTADSYGIYANAATAVTLGWTTPDDRITASSIQLESGATLQVRDGQTLTNEADNTAIISGTLSSEQIAALAGVTLRGCMVREVAGYGSSTTSGWNLIASPIEGSIQADAVGNIFSAAQYDLYRFNQAAELEWENWKSQANNNDHYHFNLESGRGYLYASKANTTLVFTGEFYDGDGIVNLEYSTQNQDVNMRGWNLIGNPFATAKTIGSKPFYRMNDLGTEIIVATESTIAAMEGIFVKATEDGETVTFAEPTRGRESEERIVINLCDNTAVIDRAIVRFGEGETLPKFQMRDNSTKVYIPQDGEEYAIVTVCRDAMHCVSTNEIPVNFEAKENGIYTLTVNPEGLEMDYLHLIDNLTGADIDLLASCRDDVHTVSTAPTYTFTAKTTDYASRFRLVFSVEDGPSTGSGTFAFINNGNIIVNGEGMLQIVDVMGRVIVCRDAMHCVSTTGMMPGVYVLRLIDGENVRTQKIVVE